MNKTKCILSCDWGTSSFRLRLVNVESEKVLNEISTGEGINVVHNEWLSIKKPEDERINFYRNFIQGKIDKMHIDLVQDVRVIISGMASSTIGMKELAYANVPFKLSGENLITKRFDADEFCKHNLLLVSGLRTNNDVLRGEETILLGCDRNDDNALVIFPGTHSKHVVVKNNVAIDFKTYMTGEFFELLSTKSLLAKSVVKNDLVNDAAFVDGVKDGAGNNILNASFHVRTNQLLNRHSAENNYHYLSGLLIGNELKDVINQSEKVYLVCSNHLSSQYKTALKILNVDDVTHIDTDKALINAHCKLFFLNQ